MPITLGESVVDTVHPYGVERPDRDTSLCTGRDLDRILRYVEQGRVKILPLPRRDNEFTDGV